MDDYSEATGTNNIKYANISLYPNLCNEIYTEAISWYWIDIKDKKLIINKKVIINIENLLITK